MNDLPIWSIKRLNISLVPLGSKDLELSLCRFLGICKSMIGLQTPGGQFGYQSISVWVTTLHNLALRPLCVGWLKRTVSKLLTPVMKEEIFHLRNDFCDVSLCNFRANSQYFFDKWCLFSKKRTPTYLLTMTKFSKLRKNTSLILVVIMRKLNNFTTL